MLVSEKIIEKKFEGTTTKDAYLSACKWISTKIIAVNNSNNITYKVEKLEQKKNSSLCAVMVTVYVSVDGEEILKTNCDVCRETTGAFYMTENKYQCYSCKIAPFKKRIENKIKLIKEGLGGKLL